MRHIVLLIATIGFFASCKKVSSLDYQAGSGAYFVGQQQRDSTNYSFANNVKVLSEDTIFLEIQILGDLANEERDIQLEAVDGSTAKEGLHYKLPLVKLPAGGYSVLYPVILYNTPDLATKTVRLELALKDNKDFTNGSRITSNRSFYNRYKINFNNRLIKPDYWMYIQNYFGEYSDVKYRFMIDELGFSDFMPDNMGGKIMYSDFINYAGQMSKALQDYEDEYGPKLDETGKPIYFPL